MSSFEAHGHWWLPEHPDNRVPGVLSWDQDDGGTLKLVGQLWPIVLLDNPLPDGHVQKYRDRTHDDDREYPVVLGEVEGAPYTLIKAIQVAKRNWSLEQSTETARVSAVLQGAHFNSPELEVDRVRIRVRDLASWIDQSGLNISYSGGADPEKKTHFATVTANSLPSLAVSERDPDVRFAQHLGTAWGGVNSACIEQDWVLHIERPAVARLETFLDVASDIQDLVSIATGRTAEFRDVVLQHPSFPQRSLAGTAMGNARQDLHYFARWTNQVDYRAEGPEASEPVPVVHMYFSLTEFGVDGVGRWLSTAAQFRSELGRVMATRYSRNSFLEDDIMNCCAALESFDKHWRGAAASYMRRIKECVTLAGPEFAALIVEPGDDWAKKVRDLRNELAHHGQRFRVEGSVGERLVAEQLYWLFILCMLRVADAPEAVFSSIVRHGEWHWLTDKAHEMLAEQA